MAHLNLDRVVTFDTIAQFLASLGLPAQPDIDFTISPLENYHGRDPLSSPAFRTNYLTFLLITGGTGHYTVDELKFELTPTTFYFTLPGHLKSFTIIQPWEGYILSVTESFLRAHLPTNVNKEFPFLVAETTPPIHLRPEQIPELQNGFESILHAYRQPSPYQQAILTNLLTVFFYKMKELLQISPAVRGIQWGYSPLVIKFRKLLDDRFRAVSRGQAQALPTLNQLADTLAVHPNYLGSLIKKETGKSVSKWFEERIVAEAKSMLKSTDLSIAEIGYALTFADPTNFTKYFRNRTGWTPSAYRLEGAN